MLTKENLSESKVTEVVFHNRYFRGEGIRAKEAIFYDKSMRNRLLNQAYAEIGDCLGKKILYLGSGTNSEIMLKFINSGAEVIAIDLSPEAIKAIQQVITSEGIEDRARAIQMDAENLDFSDSTFDVIFGRAIIHHLDIEKVNKEILRVLKEDGKAVFIEPLGYNPLINLYRFFTPTQRTKSEHPLRNKDLVGLKNGFSKMAQDNFFLFALFSFLGKIIFKNDRVFNYGFEKLCRLDTAIIKKLPFLRNLCWCTVITLYK